MILVQPLDLDGDVLDAERGGGDPVLHEGCSERLDCWVAIGLQQQLGSVRVARGGDARVPQLMGT